jgi:mannose-6-phosphate isomerase-like protein (cupin superfamily)
MEIIEFQKSGYLPLKEFGEWRVAMLKFCPDLLLENIKTMQMHMETDEVFVLINGHCNLYLMDGDNGEITKYKMEKEKLYVIPQMVYHNHTMTEDGEVLIIENSDTVDDNSPTIMLTEKQISALQML